MTVSAEGMAMDAEKPAEQEHPAHGMTKLGDPLSEWLASFEEASCTCGAKFRRRIGTDAGICPDCAERDRDKHRLSREAEAVVSNVAEWVQVYLKRAGMSERERRASLALIPASLNRKVMGQTSAALLMAGSVPERGFGLSGEVGVGKTMALAAMMKEHTAARWTKLAATLGTKVAEPALAWVRWPDTVNEWRVRSLRDGGLEDVSRTIARVERLPVVVLDDLGAERIKGAYADDWAASQLDLLIARRYDAMRPTWFTTNLSQSEFLDRYGARLYSRLCGENPFVPVAGPDLRVQKGASSAGPRP
jgi:hypothetical protein